jgi:hypothetical protein
LIHLSIWKKKTKNNMNKDQLAKDQLIQCLIDLSTRFGELGDKHTQSMLLVMAGAVKVNSQEMLALWLGEYAKLRIALMDMDENTP